MRRTAEVSELGRRRGEPSDGPPALREAAGERPQEERDAHSEPPEAVTAEDGGAPADDRAAGPDGPAPPAAQVVVPRWIQLVLVPLGVVALWSLASAASTALLVFVVAAVIALILNPLVELFQRPISRRAVKLPRGVGVLAVYAGFFTTLTAAGILLANPIADQVRALQRDVPGLIASASRTLASVQGWLDDRGLGIEIRRQGETALETLQRELLSSSDTLVAFGQDLLTRAVETGFALVLIIVISVYMLLYAERIGSLVRSVMPAGAGPPEDDYPLGVQRAVSGYVRGQLLFSAIMGASAGISLWLFGVVGIFPDGRRYALFFGIFFGLMELIPYVGPVLGALPPILVALFQDPLTAVWVALLFLALQQLEGHVVAPQVFGHSLRINPLLVIFALLVGGELYGIVGAFVALPLAAVARETALYLRRHLVLEPWTATDPVVPGLAGRALAATRPAPRPGERGEADAE